MAVIGPNRKVCGNLCPAFGEACFGCKRTLPFLKVKEGWEDTGSMDAASLPDDLLPVDNEPGEGPGTATTIIDSTCSGLRENGIGVLVAFGAESGSK